MKPLSGWGACLREPRSFVLPRERTWPRWWLIASVVAHAVVLSAVVRWTTARWGPVATRVVIMLNAPVPDTPGQVLSIAVPRAATRPLRRLPASEAGAASAAVAAASPTVPDTAAPVVVPRVGSGGRDTSRAGGGALLAARGGASITPELGNGMLWVRPMIGIPITHRPIRLDSVVALRMKAMADSIEKHPLPDPNANPYVSKPWTFRAGGKTYGIDSKGLHLGDFTIPTAVLAFLSLPQGNIDQARANQGLYEMRADILRAAARAQAEDDFRRAVRELRARKDKERQDERAQQRGNQQPVSP